MNNYNIQYSVGVAATLTEVNDFLKFFMFSQNNNRGIISNLIVSNNGARKINFTYTNFMSPILPNSPNANINTGILVDNGENPFNYAANCVVKFLSEPNKPNDAGGTIGGVIDCATFVDNILELHMASVIGTQPAITKGAILYAQDVNNSKSLGFEVVEVGFNTVLKQVVYVLEYKPNSILHEDYNAH